MFIVFVGVNGVGKSTNLAKIAYWLVQNKMKVCFGAALLIPSTVCHISRFMFICSTQIAGIHCM